MFSKKIAAMIIAVVIMIITPLCSANAGSITIMLRPEIKEISTGWLGNTTEKYRLVGSVSTSSAYSVQYVVKKATKEGADEYEVDRFQYSSMQAFTNTYKIDKYDTIAKCTIYGNVESNPKPGCYANGIFSNTN